MNLIVGLVFVVVGALSIIYPEKMLKFRLQSHLYNKDTPPSKFGLIATKIGGIIFVVFGLYCMFFYEDFISLFA